MILTLLRLQHQTYCDQMPLISLGSLKDKLTRRSPKVSDQECERLKFFRFLVLIVLLLSVRTYSSDGYGMVQKIQQRIPIIGNLFT